MAHGKRISNTTRAPVVLNLIQDADDRERALGKEVRDLKKEAATRLCGQAYEQGGCMTAAENAVRKKLTLEETALDSF